MKKPMRSVFLIVFLMSLAVTSFGQYEDANYRPPLDIPLYLSGNFGELRRNHFHTGIDIKTQGVEGFEVKAIEEGVVSRIKVSPYGYGKAIYIDHPDGRTSVYAHLSEFNDAITKFTRQAQYELESFAVDLQPGGDKLKVEKGEVIGLSGNSGSSGGPHVHFEIRETDSERPIDPLLFGFDIKDNIPPYIYDIMALPIDDFSQVNGHFEEQKFNVARSQGPDCNLSRNAPIEISGKVGFAINTIDRLNGQSNRCGVHIIRLTVGDLKVYEQRIEKLDFSLRKYFNAHHVYSEYVSEGRRFQRSHVLPNNHLNIYKHVENMGHIELEPGEEKEALYEVYDTAGNRSALSFTIRGVERDEASKPKRAIERSDFYKTFEFDEENHLVTGSCSMFLPGYSLYEDLEFCYSSGDTIPGMLTPTYKMGDEGVPLTEPYTLKLKVDNVPQGLADNLTVVKIDERNGRLYSRGGTLKDGWMETEVDEFGSFAVTVDVEKPRIRSVDFRKNMRSYRDFSFIVTDDLSGVDHIEGRIDGKWILMDFDAKRARITYTFDEARLDRGEHTFELLIRDACGNESRYESEFVW
ncbi:M23 family metallopeptidase [Halocola ammonii]